jgi:DNA-binding LytR/AlgR family response regulator
MHQSTPPLRERRLSAAHASPTAGLVDVVARPMAIAAIAAVFLAIAGAFGTGAAPLGLRFGYWLTAMPLASAIGAGLFVPAYRLGWLEERPLVMTAVLALVMSVPLTVLIWFLTSRFFPGFGQAGARFLPGYFPVVLLVSVIMTAINYLVAERANRNATHATHAAAPGAAPPKFLERIPLKLRGGELYAVQAEDHYLRLHTSRGSDLILMRLVDAVAELEGIEGAQVHRSWWVAKAAVTDARRADGRAVLTLKTGAEAPVSRSYAGALREAGWF